MAAHLEKCPFFDRYVPPEKFCYQEIEDVCTDSEVEFDQHGDDSGVNIERHWQELKEMAGMY